MLLCFARLVSLASSPFLFCAYLCLCSCLFSCACARVWVCGCLNVGVGTGMGAGVSEGVSVWGGGCRCVQECVCVCVCVCVCACMYLYKLVMLVALCLRVLAWSLAGHGITCKGSDDYTLRRVQAVTVHSALPAVSSKTERFKHEPMGSR